MFRLTATWHVVVILTTTTVIKKTSCYKRLYYSPFKIKTSKNQYSRPCLQSSHQAGSGMAVWMGGCWMLVVIGGFKMIQTNDQVRIDQWSYPSWTSLLSKSTRVYDSMSPNRPSFNWHSEPFNHIFQVVFSCLLCKSMVLSLTHCLFGPCTGLQQLHERSEFKLKFHMKQYTTAHRDIASNGDGSRPPIYKLFWSSPRYWMGVDPVRQRQQLAMSAMRRHFPWTPQDFSASKIGLHLGPCWGSVTQCLGWALQ
jgi:hypothetical protein